VCVYLCVFVCGRELAYVCACVRVFLNISVLAFFGPGLFACMHVHTCVRVYVCVRVCVCARVRVRACVCMRVLVYVCMKFCMYALMCTHTHTHTHTLFIHMCVCAYVRIHTCTNIHMYIFNQKKTPYNNIAMRKANIVSLMHFSF